MAKSGKKHTVRNIILALILILLILAAGVVIVYHHMSERFGYTGAPRALFESFYGEDNTLDGVYIGTSAVYRYWVPTTAFEEYGIAIHDMAIADEPFAMTNSLIRETLKTNPDVDVILIDMKDLRFNFEGLAKAHDIRKLGDSMRFSKNRIDGVTAGIEFYEDLGVDLEIEDWKDRLGYYLPTLYYMREYRAETGAGFREMWNKEPLEIKTNQFKGFIVSSESVKILPLEAPVLTDDVIDPDPKMLRYLDDVLEYCRTIKPKVIFTCTPYYATEEQQAMCAGYVKYIRDAGFECINFNEKEHMEALDFDWSKDWYHKHHTNAFGAERFTRYFAGLLVEELGLEDHRGQSGYESWQGAVDAYHAALEERKQKAAGN